MTKVFQPEDHVIAWEEDKHIVVFWDKEVDDYTCIGPFDSEEEANEWVAGYKVPVTVWVTSLIHPKSID